MFTSRAWRIAALGLTILAGCGYSVVTAGEGLRIGALTDLSAEGDLALVARTHLRRLAGQASEAAPQVSGRIRVLPERTAGFDEAGATLYHAPVELALTIEQANGEVAQHRIMIDAAFVRGTGPVETWAGRQAALRTAVERGVDRWWARWTGRGKR